MTIERPPFEPDSGGWMRLAAVQGVCEISKSETFDKWRKRIGKKRWEHRVRTGEHIGTWVWSPGWFTSYAILTGATDAGMSADSDLQLRLRQIRVENAEIDLQERRDKLAERQGATIAVAEVDAMFHHMLAGLKAFTNYGLNDEQKIAFTALMNEIVNDYATKYPERTAAREADAGRGASDASGVRHHPGKMPPC